MREIERFVRGQAMRRISFQTMVLVVALILIAGFTFSCASRSGMDSEGKGRILDRKALSDPPTYRQLSASMKYYEKELGIKFYQNKNGMYQPYSTAGWQSFSIADDLNECLYDITMKDLITYRSVRGSTRAMIEMEIVRGPCGIRYPDADSIAQDRVTLMEGSVVSPAIDDLVNGGVSMVRGATFLQLIMNTPWRVDSIPGGLEQAVAKVGYEVKNPLDVTFGDVVFFTEYYGERNVGVYLDYGHIVFNSCFRAQVRKMDSNMNYRIFRIYTGPNAIQYKLHESGFMQNLIGAPE
jgi:hypothetical protein